MTLDSLLPLLLGPTGFTVGLLFALYKFQRGDWVSRERLDEMRTQRDDALRLAEKAAGGTEAMATAIAQRNELERERLASHGPLPAEIRDAENLIARRRRD